MLYFCISHPIIILVHFTLIDRCHITHTNGFVEGAHGGWWWYIAGDEGSCCLFGSKYSTIVVLLLAFRSDLRWNLLWYLDRYGGTCNNNNMMDDVVVLDM